MNCPTPRSAAGVASHFAPSSKARATVTTLQRRAYTLRGGSERIDSLNFGHTAVKSAIEMHHRASRGTAVASSASACSPTSGRSR